MQGNRPARRSAVRSGVLTGLSTAGGQRLGGARGRDPLAQVRPRREDGRLLRRLRGLRRARAGRERAARRRAAAVRAGARGRAARPRGRIVVRSRSRCRSCRRSWSRVAAPHAVAGALTGERERAARARPQLLPWLVPAAAAQIYAGVAASALAALDDYGTAAFGFGARRRRRARRRSSRSSTTASRRSAGGSR